MTLATDLSPLSSSATLAARPPAAGRWSRDHRPPRGLYIPSGVPTGVRFGDTLPPKGGRTAAQRLGLAYEQKVIDVLTAIYADKFIHSIPLLFEDRRGLHRCIPDGVLRLDDVSIVIIEVKLAHTEKAWWQLERLYTPVVRQMVGPFARIFRCEICRSYDPSVAWPGPHSLRQSLHKLSDSEVGVLQWKF